MGAIRIFIRSMKYAWDGVIGAATERSFQIHIVAAIVVCAFGFLFNISRVDWSIILICIGMVMGMEAMNSAVERLVDFVCPQLDPRAGKIKDLSAGAVLIVSAIAAVVGIIIFWPYILTLLSYTS